MFPFLQARSLCARAPWRSDDPRRWGAMPGQVVFTAHLNGEREGFWLFARASTCPDHDLPTEGPFV
jgi:hypothetical protein